MGWSETLSKLPELFYKVAKLAVDIQNVQRDVEKLQEQNRTLSEKVNAQENEIKTLKALNEANDKAHLQTLTIAKYELEKHINSEVARIVGAALSSQAIEFKAELAAFARSHAQHSNSAQALVTSDGNDGQKKL
ncbi:MAG TPA: hypothetical protein VGB07_36365 [Blastocatellia bacterium]